MIGHHLGCMVLMRLPTTLGGRHMCGAQKKGKAKPNRICFSGTLRLFCAP